MYMEGEHLLPFGHPVFLRSCTAAVLEDVFFSVRTEIPVEGADGVFFSWTSQTLLSLLSKETKI